MLACKVQSIYVKPTGIVSPYSVPIEHFYTFKSSEEMRQIITLGLKRYCEVFKTVDLEC